VTILLDLTGGANNPPRTIANASIPAAMRTGTWYFDWTPGYANGGSGTSFPTFLSTHADDLSMLFYHEGGGVFQITNTTESVVLSVACTWGSGATLRFQVDPNANTLTISGATTGNGTTSITGAFADWFPTGQDLRIGSKFTTSDATGGTWGDIIDVPSVVTSGGLSYGSTSVTGTIDGGNTAGDTLIFLVATKPDTATIGSPGGSWSAVGSQYSGGGGTTGADTGPTKIAAYSKTAAGGDSNPTSSITSGNSSWCQVLRLSGAWSLAAVGGTDSTTGSSWSVTCDSDPDILPDDVLIAAACIPTDVTTPAQFGSYAISATGVSSWGTVSEINEPDSGTGNDIGGFVFWVKATAGDSSAAPVVTATAGGTTTNVRGPLILIRARASSGGFTSTATGAASPFANSATGSVVFTATASSAAAAFALSASGLEQFSSTATAAASANAASATGNKADNAGTASAALSALSAAAAGAEAFSGTGAAAASQVTASATGTETFTGTSSAAASPAAVSGSGATGTVFTSTGDAAAAAPAASATGAESFAGTSSAAASPFASAGTGSAGSVFTSTGSAAISSHAAACTGTETFPGSATSACSPPGAAGAGAESFTSTCSGALQPYAAAANGAQGTVFTSTAAAAWSACAVASSGAEAFPGSVSAAGAPFGSASVAAESFTSSADAALPPFEASGTLLQALAGAAAAVVQSFRAAARESVPVVLTRFLAAVTSRTGTKRSKARNRVRTFGRRG
jgi:hypothetical protein